MKAELDLEMIKRLYEYGGLLVYHVEYFSPVSFSILKSISTFSESVAKHEFERLREAGFPAEIRKELIHFDGAFAK